MVWGTRQSFQGVDWASKFPRFQSDRASVGCAGQKSQIPGGLTLQIKQSNVLVPVSAVFLYFTKHEHIGTCVLATHEGTYELKVCSCSSTLNVMLLCSNADFKMTHCVQCQLSLQSRCIQIQWLKKHGVCRKKETKAECKRISPLVRLSSSSNTCSAWKDKLVHISQHLGPPISSPSVKLNQAKNQ